MERLTKSNVDFCGEYCVNGDSCGYAQGKIPTMCDDAARYYKLRDYEESGLEPPEIKSLLAEWKVNLEVLNHLRGKVDNYG